MQMFCWMPLRDKGISGILEWDITHISKQYLHLDEDLNDQGQGGYTFSTVYKNRAG